MSLKKILIIIPTYNERDNIAYLLKKIENSDIKADILIIDGGSLDGTAQVVEGLQQKYFNLALIKRNSKVGLGSAYKEGFSRALGDNIDLVVQIDADLSHSPFDILPMLRYIPEYDMVIGSRYVSSGGVINWPLLRFSLSRIANFFSKILLRVPISDLTSGFKIIKREVLEAVEFNTIKSKGYAFQMEITLRAHDKGFNIKEYPIIFKGREKEKSKFSFSIVLEAMVRVILFFIVRFKKDNET
ncbi:MAG: polyprenol monophosphomannose synthase [Candidatus Omnitrophica bacterium]|nr:polyprenol monophosphomannose synthase [Candidatus Omnitrophota bacterium]MCF7891947.1 polyprenol monophosphomannose synthase [Candidatus Omnitrophota bacterium]MCF7895491.1 polyprenol monophosphomannose synthase [Candidatus Omnitrophota bacterium]MCF7897996.1 polyprenol monophosphomannose synthase [Candidatus Omnitrophota bacterium]MCF7909650.1 polyprenol monophosphomannose synthase [Candidatus Omnitrophota bacterium]